MSDYISEDLLFLILKRLPVETLLRCRCVCKSWKLLVDSNSFKLDHLDVQTPRIIAQKIRGNEYMAVDLNLLTLPLKSNEFFGQLLTLPLIPQDDTLIGHNKHSKPYIAVAGISHGVICLYDNENLLLLWNPTIRRHLTLPLPKIRPFVHDSYAQHYDFKCCGFWIDNSLSHFKIVILFPAQSKLAVFSSVKWAWTEVAMESDRVTDVELSWSGDPQILIGGVAHWKLCAPHHISVEVIACFDFGQDKLGTIELPRIEDVDHGSRIVKWRDCVAVTHWQHLSPFGCDFWAMQNGSWSKMFSINLAERAYDVWYVEEGYGRVLALSREGRILLFDPRKDGCTCRLKSSFTSSGYVSWICDDFVESLVFPAQEYISSA